MNFDYYEVFFKLRTPMLGTATDASIWKVHIIEKAKKEIKKANRLGTRINKTLDKYVKAEISEKKETQELQGIIKVFCELLGKPDDIATNITDLLLQAKELEEEFNEQIKKHEQVKATIFLRNRKGMPIIGTHMILGNLKENLRIMINNGDKSILKSKVSVGETMALDVKPVQNFMTPNMDILRGLSDEEMCELPIPGKGCYVNDNSGRILLERPIVFDRKGVRETAIALSEVLPEGAEFGCVLRVRKSNDKELVAPINEDALRTLFDHGKSNGFGTWRGSGNMGSYVYKLEKLENYKEPVPEGWN